jgi:hypothetical protein
VLVCLAELSPDKLTGVGALVGPPVVGALVVFGFAVVGHALHTGQPSFLLFLEEEPHGHGAHVDGCPAVGSGAQVLHTGHAFLLFPGLVPHGQGGHVLGEPAGGSDPGHVLHTGHPLLLLLEEDPHGHGAHVSGC